VPVRPSVVRRNAPSDWLGSGFDTFTSRPLIENDTPAVGSGAAPVALRQHTHKPKVCVKQRKKEKKKKEKKKKKQKKKKQKKKKKKKKKKNTSAICRYIFKNENATSNKMLASQFKQNNTRRLRRRHWHAKATSAKGDQNSHREPTIIRNLRRDPEIQVKKNNQKLLPTKKKTYLPGV
jgi:hypothetical protein